MNESLQSRTDRVIWLAAIVFLMTFAWHETFAAPPSATVAAAPTALDTYRNECGACHVAYPPRLLPQASWQTLMRGLDKHFGVDASLDAASTTTIASFLQQASASIGRNAGPTSSPPLRITETGWFQHEHSDIPPSVWQRKSIGSPSNCAACHAGAEQGLLSEHGVRIPR